MLSILILCSLFISTYQDVKELEFPKVTISAGTIEGHFLKNSENGKNYYAFQGIPFAKPPIGDLRFQPPQKLDKFNGTLQAKNDSLPCLQEKGGSEDCLYLNVYTNEIGKDNLRPVMVWFYPGRFMVGEITRAWNGPDYLLEEDVVLVFPAYRLYAFGFLSTQDAAAEGNAGLKDQVAALEWVKENIEVFGGDPNQVTIFGCSAGSASVHYLSISPLARGLFQRAIMQSGSAINEWAFQPNPKEKAIQLGNNLRIDTDNTSLLIEKLQKVPAMKLMIASKMENMGRADAMSVFHFAPTIERNHSGAFITKSPYQLLEENSTADVTYMIGYSKGEGRMVLPSPTFPLEIDFVEDEEKQYYMENNKKLIPKTMNIPTDSNNTKLVIDEITSFFFNNESIKNETKFLKFVEQYMFVKSIRKSVEMMKGNRDIYFYKFNYKDGGHSSELPYMLKLYSLEKDDKEMSRMLVKMWTNFAKTGNPTPSPDPILNSTIWEKVSKDTDKGVAYLNIGQQLKMGKNVDQEYFDFWLKLYDKYGLPPYYDW